MRHLPSARRRRSRRARRRRTGSRTASRGRGGSRTRDRCPTRAERPRAARPEGRGGRPRRRRRRAEDRHARAPTRRPARARTAVARLRRRNRARARFPAHEARASRSLPPPFALPRARRSFRSRRGLQARETRRARSALRRTPTRSGPAPRSVPAAVRSPRPCSSTPTVPPLVSKVTASAPNARARKTRGSPRCERSSAISTIATETHFLEEQLMSTTLDFELVAELAGQVSGSVLGPSYAGYDAARAVHNGLIDRRPGLIVSCGTTQDVVAALAFARRAGLEISVRGGGHNVAGRAVTEGGVMIDLAEMNGISIDPGRAIGTAEGGVIWGELNAAAAEHGLAVTGGAVSGTGIAGYTLGGGLGWLMSKYGLAADNLLAVELVTAEGDVLHVDGASPAGLF